MDIGDLEKGDGRKVEIFCCYARRDQPFLLKLKVHLMPLQQEELITLWADTDIDAGTEWEEQIHRHLDAARIILLLISPDFMASNYCYSIEMKEAIEQHKRGAARVVPVILRPVDWYEAPFSALQALPSGGKPVTRWSGPHGRDTAFANIAMGIRTLVKELQSYDISHKRAVLGKELAFYSEKSKDLTQFAPFNTIFSFGRPLTNPEEFYGREYECLQLLDIVRRKSCLSIVGPLRIGKTWLLQYLMLVAEKELDSTFVIRYMDATLLQPLTKSGFFIQTVELFADSVDPFANDSHSNRLSIFRPLVESGKLAQLLQQDPEYTFRYVLDVLERKGLHAVLCIDEFDAFIKHNDTDFFGFMRANISKGYLTIVTASRRYLYEIMPSDNYTSPLSDVFRTIEVGTFIAKDAEQFIRVKGTQAGLTEQEQRHLLIYGQMEKDQWYPLHLQLAGMMLLEDKDFASKKDQSYYRPDDPTYWQDFKRRLKKQIFIIEGKTYESLATEELRVTEEDVKDALNKLDDLLFLQDCELSKTHYISLHDNGNSGSSLRKGQLVRELLLAASENMKPTGTRNDIAIEWRLYNILYYRYFRFHLTIEKVMARLGISRYQFYREREKAVQVLLEEILKF